MKIAFVTHFDLAAVMEQPAAWRNPYLVSFFTANALKAQGGDLTFIGASLPAVYRWFFTCKEQFYVRLLKKRYQRDREPFILKYYARQVAKQLAQTDVDVVFSPSSIPIAHLECKWPIVFWTDATFAGMIDFYDTFTNLNQGTIQNGNAMEQMALKRAALAIYTSDWAAQTAINNYDVDPAKIRVVPRGANIEQEPTLSEVETKINARPTGCCKLLFVGNYWQRKGGNIALAVAEALNNAGLPTTLTVVGQRHGIDDAMLPDFVHPISFISKATPEGRQQLNTLMAESHFLILPTRAETLGITFLEASAFGVPSLATHVGGISTAIKDGVNGQLFVLDAPIEAYTQYILNLMNDYAAYKQLTFSTFNEYKTRLNWRVVGQQLHHLLDEVVSRPL